MSFMAFCLLHRLQNDILVGRLIAEPPAWPDRDRAAGRQDCAGQGSWPGLIYAGWADLRKGLFANVAFIIARTSSEADARSVDRATPWQRSARLDSSTLSSSPAIFRAHRPPARLSDYGSKCIRHDDPCPDKARRVIGPNAITLFIASDDTRP